MARLNEAPVAVDPLEALRRKFLRQNRDIARDNSNKSLRIRSLENEVSRLLAENLGYREQVAHFENEIGASKNRRIIDHVNTTKSKLEVKLEEMMALVQDMKHVPATRRRVSTEPKRAEARSPGSKARRNMALMSEDLAEQEGRLAPILEHKLYPRRTFDHTELSNMIQEQAADTTDSPDIGPPPVLESVDSDPVKFDLVSRPKPHMEDEVDLQPALSVNLEQRRRRRESSGPSGANRAPSNLPKLESEGPEPVSTSLKAGAKRKLDVREDETSKESGESAQESQESFHYVCKMADDKTAMKPLKVTADVISRTIRENATAKGVHRERKFPNTISAGTRRALGSKTTNFDVANSPKKAANNKLAARDEVAAAKNDLKESQENNARPKLPNTLTIETVAPAVVTNVAEISVMEPIQPEPETPVPTPEFNTAHDSAPSSERVFSRDTPPPADFAGGADGTRPSRRARAAVSYAEPNLRDKMRRPTKDLVDAVTGEGKSIRTSILIEDEAPVTAVKIKEEQCSGNKLAIMPAVSAVNVYASSPISSKNSNIEDGPANSDNPGEWKISILQLGGMKDLSQPNSRPIDDASLGKPSSAKPERKETNAQETLTTTVKTTAVADIFEFNETTPKKGLSRPASTNSMRDERPSSRTSRRASSALGTRNEKASSDIESGSRLQQQMARRRQSVLGTETNQHAADTRLARSSANQANLAVAEEASSRGERAAVRRRSMML